MKQQSTEASFAEMSAQLAVDNPELQEEKKEVIGETAPEVTAEQIAEFTPALEDVRSPEVIKQEETQVAEIHAAIRERLAAKEPVRVEAPKQEPFKMEELSFDVPSIRAHGNHEVVGSDTLTFGKETIKQASGGLIEYVPNSKQNKYGFEFEGGAKISTEKLEQLKINLETSEKKKSQEAFEYVKIPDNAWGAEHTKNLNLNDSRGFGGALDVKRLHNEDVRKKIFTGSVVGAATAVVGGLGTVAVGGPGTAMALMGMGIMGFGGGAILALGGLAWGGKKLYDSYKEKKAAKNFMTASVAKQVRQQVSASR